MEERKRTIREIGAEMIQELPRLREKRRRDFEKYMEKHPETLKAGERYRDGRRKFYGDLLFALMGMCEDEEDFTTFTEKVLTEDDENLQYEFFALDEALKKLKDSKLAEDIRSTAYGILSNCEAFYLALGAYIGQNYRIVDPAALQEIDDVGKLMAEEEVFPIIAKADRSSAGPKVPVGVIPARSTPVAEPSGKGAPEKKKSEYLTLAEVAEMVGFCKTWVYRKARANKIPHIRVGHALRFTKVGIDRWMSGHSVRGCL